MHNCIQAPIVVSASLFPIIPPTEDHFLGEKRTAKVHCLSVSNGILVGDLTGEALQAITQ